jgi:hypothetical protein
VFSRAVVARQGGVCHLCSHGGARQADHVLSYADRPDLAWDPSNIRPAHGAPGNPCRECSAMAGRPVYCNQLRGPMSIERAKRVIAELTRPGQDARPEPRPKPDPDAGRPW